MRYVVAVVAVILYSGIARAQVCPANTYCYYVPPASPGTTQSLFLHAPFGTFADVSVNGGSSFVVNGGPIVVAGASFVAAGYSAPGLGGGFITSTQPLIVHLRGDDATFNDGQVIKASRMALGTRFRAVGYHLNDVGLGSDGFDELSIYAPSGGTVTITPPAGAPPSFWADGFTGSVDLDPSETVIVRTLPGVELSGALVIASAPIAVSSGGRGYRPGECGDAGYDNIVPVAHADESFVVFDPDTTAPDEGFTVIADTSGTVTVNGTDYSFAAGESRFFAQPAQTAVISATQPVQVYQYTAAGAHCDYGMAAVPPVSFFASAPSSSIGFEAFAAGTIVVFLPLTADGTGTSFNGSNLGWETIVGPVGGVNILHRDIVAGEHELSSTTDSIVAMMLGTAPGTGSTFDYLWPYRLEGCGDAAVAGAEVCDDGNVVDFDACSTTCLREDGIGPCTAGGSECAQGTVCHPGAFVCVNDCHTYTCPASGEECAPSFCDNATSVCGIDALAAGTACDSGAGVCGGPSNAVCLECLVNADCVTREGPGSTCGASNICELGTPTVDDPADESTLNEVRPRYEGTGPANAALAVIVDGANVGSTTISAGGTWFFDQPTDLGLTDHTVLVRATAGTLTANSLTIDFAIISGCVDGGDCSPATPICSNTTCVECVTGSDCPTGATCDSNACELAAPVVIAPADGSTTSSTRPQVTGTAVVGTTVSVILDNVTLGTAPVDGSGNWSFTPAGDLNRGAHTVRARAVSGSVQSPVSNTQTFTIIADCSTTADCPSGATCSSSFACIVAAPVVQSPTNGSTINTTQPTFSGTAPAGTTVTVNVDAASVGTATTNGTGAWSLASTASLSLGAHTLQATARAGTVTSTLSNTNTFTVISGCLSDTDCGSGELCNAQRVCIPGPGGDDTDDDDDDAPGGPDVGGGGVSCNAGGGGSLAALLLGVLLSARRLRARER